MVLDLIPVRSYGGMRYYKLQNFNVVREDGRRMKYEKKTIRTENIQLAVMTLSLFACPDSRGLSDSQDFPNSFR